jgi:hypothetical protein
MVFPFLYRNVNLPCLARAAELDVFPVHDANRPPPGYAVKPRESEHTASVFNFVLSRLPLPFDVAVWWDQALSSTD